MCQKCNEALIAAAQAASLLANAAKDLYNINQSEEAKILAEAAAELFKTVPEELFSGETSAGKGNPENTPEDVKLPEGFHITDEGVVFINGVALGRIVVLGKPTKH